jgi:predicted acyl esterase
MRARVLTAAALLGLAALIAASCTTAAHAATSGGGWKARPATYGVVKTTDVLITMSDGVQLDADVVRPARAAGAPAPGRYLPQLQNSGGAC